MLERDRPIEERVSVLDRPRAELDALPPSADLHGRLGELLEPESVRLAAVSGDIRLYLARGTDGESLVQLTRRRNGGGASAGPRSTLVTHGARVGWSSGGGLSFSHGIVPDTVTAVRVGEVDAVLGENGFIAVGTQRGESIVLTTTSGERTIEFPSIPPWNADASSPNHPGYAGLVEYAQSGITGVEIEDLDDPQWIATLSMYLMGVHAPDVWRVGVVLLEGHRAGELAMADLVVRKDEEGRVISVELRGRSAFGPHPDPPRLEAALERLRDPVRPGRPGPG